ncbi:hypothetical protein LV84_04304 [Algoriphagus ratkowskyi]|uniref:Uncharacterized protein n=1 Tax=Algoriphagus ratkowskyi TaxID=57028 RepID=A0A2W7QZB5_9BACT|nr:hypothetical protein LV84_04304 [Algoriphagus ratkowskyi]
MNKLIAKTSKPLIILLNAIRQNCVLLVTKQPYANVYFISLLLLTNDF